MPLLPPPPLPPPHVLGGTVPRGRSCSRVATVCTPPHAQVLVGRKSGEIEALLGAPGQAEMIHRDDMVLAGYDA